MLRTAVSRGCYRVAVVVSRRQSALSLYRTIADESAAIVAM